MCTLPVKRYPHRVDITIMTPSAYICLRYHIQHKILLAKIVFCHCDERRHLCIKKLLLCLHLFLLCLQFHLQDWRCAVNCKRLCLDLV